MADTSFQFTVPDCDLDDVQDCRRKMIAAIHDPALEELVGNLRVAEQTAASGPTPRGGSASVSGTTNNKGDWEIKGEVKITW